MPLQAAFYKATRPGIPGIYNRLVRAWEPGEYSHCELIFSDGLAASASFMDGGVRFKDIDFHPAHWDIIDLGWADEDYARQWFVAHEHAPYDVIGQVHFVISPVRGSKRGYWCSEAMAAALRLKDPWRCGPNLLHAVLSSTLLNPASAGFLLPG